MYLLALTGWHYFYAITLSLLSIFMVLVILVQRGRGGGLAGALGGMGGQSAFGAKAGDTFTRITIAVASTWIVICVLLFFIYSHQHLYTGGDEQGASPTSAPVKQNQ